MTQHSHNQGEAPAGPRCGSTAWTNSVHTNESGIGASHTRRRFLKGTAIAAAGAATGALLGRGAFGPDLLPFGPQTAHAAVGKVTVLYDGDGAFGWMGDVHSKLLTNLLSRFGYTGNKLVRKRISAYTRGDIAASDATFYLGSAYSDAGLPASFLADVMASTKPIVWCKYNLQQLAWGSNAAAFKAKFGINYYGNVLWPNYSRIMYKSIALKKFNGGSADAYASELGWADPVDTTKATVVATAVDAVGSGWPIPYITRAANLWYVGDIPFTYMSEEDRYLAFCDVLFDILGTPHAQTKRALVRIEDVNSESDPAELRRVADYLSGAGVPFSVALIPIYMDPLGIYNNGTPQNIPISQATDVLAALQYMRTRGGEIVMHGTTHQFGTDANPYNAVSGDEFEFYKATENPDHTLTYVGPVPGDSTAWCTNRLNQGITELNRARLPYIGWESPHYAASATDYLVMGNKFNLSYHRALYFEGAVRAATAGGGSQTKGAAAKAASKRGAASSGAQSFSSAAAAPAPPVSFGGQFFPYVIPNDFYGQKTLPENLGNIEPVAWPDPVVGPYPARSPQDLINAAQKNLVIRDAWASFFFHPFWDVNLLRQSVEGIKALGYTFTKASTITV